MNEIMHKKREKLYMTKKMFKFQEKRNLMLEE